VTYVEEPRRGEGPARLERVDVNDHLTVLVPHTPVDAAGFHDAQLAGLVSLLTRHLADTGSGPDVAWLTTPMALPLAHALNAPCIAYDCMEPLSDLRNAPRQMGQRERALARRADLVFAGGPSLYGERVDSHPAVHCLPNAVDAAHFSPAPFAEGGPAQQRAQALQGALRSPRLGFHGPIDERVDLDLVTAVADAHPEWTVVMAGATDGTDGPALALPRRPNLHWLGTQRYEDLPALMAGWDLALQPFAMNEANRFASPLQTLENLAADLPVVSTPLRDVAWLYGEAVRLAAPGAEGFVQACEETLAESAAARCRRSLAAMSVVSMHSWERSADTVHALLSQSRERGRRSAPPALRALAG